MKSPKPPPQPDYNAIAGQQSAQNLEAATRQQQTNMVSQYTPEGNLVYSQNGSWEGGAPRFEARTEYTPEQQAILGQNNELDKRTNQIALDQTQRIGQVLSQPVNLNNEATEARLFELGSKRLDPRFKMARDSLDTNLANKGITMGSDAWKYAQGAQGEQENDAYNQLLLTGRGQAVQEALTERNQPINEITALMGAGQIGTPNFTNTPTAGVNPVDIAGMQMQGYQNQMQQYQTDVASRNAMLGAVAGVAGAGLGGWLRRR